ncbi:hypothetical protein SAZ_03570 [Streptomyces noursei ZPM]|nr:hypothetical protein SAZ_03570 [Streptomyces noursei ZPM]
MKNPRSPTGPHGMDTRTALALVLGGLAVYLAYYHPVLGAAIGIGVVVVTLLLSLLDE